MKRIRQKVADDRGHTDASLGAERASTDANIELAASDALVAREGADALHPPEERAYEAHRVAHDVLRHDTNSQLLIERAAADSTVTALAEAKWALAESQSAEVTERKRAGIVLEETERQLRQAQKMEAVGRLAGGVAHDFNNVLSVILSYAEILLAEMKPGDLRDDIEEMRKAGQRAADLTRQLLMFSRQQLLEPKVLDLSDVLTDMDKMLQRILGADVDLVSIPTQPLGRARVDRSSIEQVIMNLVVNARDAMPTGGKLTIETGNVVLDDAYARGHLGVSSGPHVMLAVTDTGIGMDRATQARIFEPFFTTKPIGKGTGLGLSTVFGIVQ